jgi:hypothetical protein
MRNSWTIGFAISAVLVAAGTLWLESTWAQEPAEEYGTDFDEDRERQQLEKAMRAVAEAKRQVAADKRRMAKIHHKMDPRSAIRQAAEALRDAEGDDAKADAETTLRGLLADYFDEDMVRRVAELEDIEKRVRTLRSQLQRRGNHKPEIIDLQVKVLVNEADGLGFFTNAEPSAFIFAPGGPGRPGGDSFQIRSPGFEVPISVGVPTQIQAFAAPASPPPPPREPKPAPVAAPKTDATSE